MSTIDSKNPSVILPDVQPQQIEQQQPANQISAQALTDSSGMNVQMDRLHEVAAAAKESSGAADIPLPPPALPTISMSESAKEGAESFGYQLEALGSPVDNDDLLMARFLKLQVLGEHEDLKLQGLARGTIALLMKAAILGSKQGMLQKAAGFEAEAQQYVNQAKALAAKYEVGGGGMGGGMGGGFNAGGAQGQTVMTFQNDQMQTSNPTLQAALQLYGEALALEESGDTGAAGGKHDAALAMVAQFAGETGAQQNPSGGSGGQNQGSGQLAQLDGQTYDIGNIPAAELTQIVGLLAKASELSDQADVLRSANTQGEAARYLRKGGYLVDSQKRLVGHEQYIDAVMKSAHGSESKDARQKALEEMEKARQEIIELILDSVAKKTETQAAFSRSIMG